MGITQEEFGTLLKEVQRQKIEIATLKHDHQEEILKNKRSIHSLYSQVERLQERIDSGFVIKIVSPDEAS